MTDALKRLVPLDGPIRVLDVGASPIDGAPPYQALVDHGSAEVIGFEPNPEALAELQQNAKEHEKYFGYALGDGERHELHFCRAPGMNSLYEPDPVVLGSFNLFAGFGTVERIESIDTHRLDDLEEVGSFDMAKLDVQGFEKAIIDNGRNKFADCLVVHSEVAFVPLYKKQPCLGEVDILLRDLGYVLHTFFSLKKWGVAPLVIRNDPRWGHNQVIDGDAVYVRSCFDLTDWSDEAIAKLIHIMHDCYRSVDVAYYLIRELISRRTLRRGADAEYLGLAGTAGV